MQFVKHGSEALMPPFMRSVPGVGNQNSLITVVIHSVDTELVEDGNVHVYYNPPLNTNRDIYVLENGEDDLSGANAVRSSTAPGKISNSFVSAGITGKIKPRFLYVREGDSFGELEELMEFLNRQFYRLKNEEEALFVISSNTDPFSIFVNQIGQKTSGPLEQYLKEIFRSMGLKEEHIVHILAYSNIFYVALVDQDMNPDPLANYELLEFVGDLAAWKPLTDIFIEYAEKHGIAMTEQVITAMHRSFASKEKQAQVARKLALNVYLKKKGEITIDTYEDIFESFVGAMFLVDFHLRALLSLNLNLHEQFLRWVYAGWDLSDYEEKPEITKFYEYMRVLAGKSVFKEREINGQWIMREERGTMQLITERLIEYLQPQENNVDREGAQKEILHFSKYLFSLIRAPYPNSEEVYERRREKYREINELIEEGVGISLIHAIANDRNMEGWDDMLKEELVSIPGFDISSYVVSQRFIDKSRSSYYWIVQDDAGIIIYSTMDHDDSENPVTLINVIKKQLESPGNRIVPSMTIERVPYSASNGETFYFEETGTRWFLRGTPTAIEAYVVKAYQEGTGRFYLILTGLPEGDKAIEYDARPYAYFKNDRQFDILKKVLAEQTEDRVAGMSDASSLTSRRPELSSALHRYIGDRTAYGYTALIAIMNHQITSVHQLTDVRNFYRSKSLKKEITRLIGIRDENSELIEFDQLIGRHMSIAEKVIMYVYLHVPIEPRVIYRPESRIKSLRMALFVRANSAQSLSTKANNTKSEVASLRNINSQSQSGGNRPKSEIRVRDGRFIYEASNELKLSLPIAGFDNERVRTIFANWILNYERSLNPTIDVIRNFRFSSLPGFDTLRQAMEFKNVSEWQLFRNKKGGLELRYFTIGDEKVIYISGSDIESINRHL